MKKYIISFCCLLASYCCYADFVNIELAENVEGIFETDGDNCQLQHIVSYDDVTVSELDIPEIVSDYWSNKYKVTSIGNRAFTMSYPCNHTLERINLPESITSIGDMAFFNLRQLKEVNIPKNLEYLGGGAFAQTAIENVVIPNTIKEIRPQTFYACTSLKEVTLPASLTSVGAYAFYYTSALENIQIPNTVKFIYQYAFAASAIKSISLPNGLEGIGTYAFAWCSNLKSLYIPYSVTQMGSNIVAFCELDKLEVSPNNEYFTMNNGMLMSKDLSALYIYSTKWIDEEIVTMPSCKTIYSGAMASCARKVKKYIVPASVEQCNVGSFSNDYTLEAIEVSPDNAFFRSVDGILYTKDKSTIVYVPCNINANNFTFDPATTTIGNYAFEANKYLMNLTIPAHIDNISQYAFASCRDLTTVVIEESQLPLAGGYAFVGTQAKDISVLRPFDDSKLLAGALYVENLTFGKTVNYFENLTFQFEYNYLKTLTLQSTTPPVFACETPFNEEQFQSLTVIVPEESNNVYSHAEHWRNFVHMEYTSLDELFLEDNSGADVFDLNGRLIHPTNLTPGIYIINGKKVLIR